MTRSPRRILRDLMGRGGDEVIQRLDAQVDVVARAVELVVRVCRDAEDLADRVAELEREGDDRRADLTRFLSSALVTPIDREDLFRLSRSIDDVLDNVRDFARELRLYDPPTPEDLVPALVAIDAAVGELRRAVGALREPPRAIVEAARSFAHTASQVRHRYEDAIAALLDRPADSGSLRQRELLRRLDVVGLRLGEAANALADGGLKRVE
jgi:ABC-type transporter Mla subunit MlaD